MDEDGVLPLHGVVQHCEWGGYDFIPGQFRNPVSG
jgi:hypothetical protein